MKIKAIALMLTIAFLTGLSACQNPDSSDSSPNKDNKVTITAKDTMDADQLTMAAEQLMGPTTWHLADKVFGMALDKDPNNKKAQFYRAMLKPSMKLEGIAKRIKPLARITGDITELETRIKNFPESPAKSFALNGAEDIKTAKDLQDILIFQRESWKEFHQFLKDNQGLELTLYVNPSVYEETVNKSISNTCLVKENTAQSIIVDCDMSQVAVKKVNSADIQGLTQAAAGIVMAYDFATAYSSEGLEKINKELRTPGKTAAQIQALVESIPTLGKLRQDNKISRSLNLGADFKVAVRWALQFQDRLCVERPGMLLGKRMCVEASDKTQADLALLEKGLMGPIDLLLKNGADRVNVNAAQFMKNPAQDLRLIAPTAYNKCNQATSLRDATLGGVLPNGDSSKFLAGQDCI